VGQHSSASASRLLGLDGFEVLATEVVGGEWRLAVQTTAELVGCAGCGVRAQAHGRRTVRVRDLPAGGRPVVLCWRKRLWRCGEPACGVRTWTERMAAIAPRMVLTQRARAEAWRVGKDTHAVAAVARDLGSAGRPSCGRWLTTASRWWRTPRAWRVSQRWGWTSPASSRRPDWRPTQWVTGLVDLERGRLLDVVADRTRAAVDGWLGARPAAWLARIGAVALDPCAGMPARWSPRLATPGWWWTTSTPSGWPTRWSTRSAGGPSRPPSGIGAARRFAVPHPQAAADRPRATHPAGMGAAAGRPSGWRSDRPGGSPSDAQSWTWPLSCEFA
jgi:hypothetical protein